MEIFNLMKLVSLRTTTITTLMLFSVCVSIFFWSDMTEAAAAVKPPENLSFPAFFSFGDSFLDTGNNNNLNTTVRCNFPPYGKDFLGGKPTGRFTNGKQPVDLLVEFLGIKELLPPYLDPNLQVQELYTGVNFASGGSGYDPQTAKILSAYSVSDQLDFFRDYIGKLRGIARKERANAIVSGGLYLVSASTNDIETTYFNSNISRIQYGDFASYASYLVRLASQFVKDLHILGARNFLILGAPPLGCLPYTITVAGRGSRKQCIDKYNQAAMIFNSQLSTEIDSLDKNLPQSRVLYVDVYYSALEIIQNPKKYDFDVTDRGCCGTGFIEAGVSCNKSTPLCADDTRYIFWDSYHPTEKTHRILFNTIKNKILNSFPPT